MCLFWLISISDTLRIPNSCSWQLPHKKLQLCQPVLISRVSLDLLPSSFLLWNKDLLSWDAGVFHDFSSQAAGNETVNFVQRTLYMPYVPCSTQKNQFQECKFQKNQSPTLNPEAWHTSQPFRPLWRDIFNTSRKSPLWTETGAIHCARKQVMLFALQS